jgi:hypothetical protein
VGGGGYGRRWNISSGEEKPKLTCLKPIAVATAILTKLHGAAQADDQVIHQILETL